MIPNHGPNLEFNLGEAADAIREVMAIFEGTELAFRVRIVIGDVGAAVVLGDARVGQQERHLLGDHRPTPVAVNIQLASWDVVLADGLFEKTPGQLAALPRRHHPACNVAAEDVEHHMR